MLKLAVSARHMLDLRRPPQPWFKPARPASRLFATSPRPRLGYWKWRWRAAGRFPRLQFKNAWLAAALVGAAGLVAHEAGFPLMGCNVKGNISVSGERIYHVPGPEFY